MKRNMDLIRALLLAIEDSNNGDGKRVEIRLDGVSKSELTEHLFLLSEAGLIEGVSSRTKTGRAFDPTRLTWTGHDFLEAIREPAIWRQAKAGAKKAGTETIEFIWDLAKVYGKAAIKEKLGIDLS